MKGLLNPVISELKKLHEDVNIISVEVIVSLKLFIASRGNRSL